MRKYLTFFIIIILVLLCCYTGKVIYVSNMNTKTSYVAIGDSITSGTRLSQPEDGFPHKFAALMDLSDNYQNYGKEGLVTAQLTQLISNQEIKDSLSKARYISITIGGNDIIDFISDKAKDFTDYDVKNAKKIPEFAKNNKKAKYLESYLETSRCKKMIEEFTQGLSQQIKELLEKILEINPDADILLQTIYNPISGSDYDSLSDCVDAILIPVNTEIMNLDGGQIYVCDTYQEFLGNAPAYVRVDQDDIHPNKDGHSIIAKGLYASIETPHPAASLSKALSAKTKTETKKVSSFPLFLSEYGSYLGTVVLLLAIFLLVTTWVIRRRKKH